MVQLDEYGIPIVDIPALQSSWKLKIIMFALVHILFPLIMPLVLIRAVVKNSLLTTLTNLRDLHNAVSRAHRNPILSLPQNKNKKLIGQVWNQPSARPYIINHALEYQKLEGYCGRSTLRNILRSFPNFPKDLVPEPYGGSSDPRKWSKVIHDLADEHHAKMPPIKTRIIPGDISYDEFVEEIRVALSDTNCRIALNYLRPVLVGFKTPRFFPANFMLSLMSGHFSPIIGMVDDDKDGNGCLIAVFDVNHIFGGTYLVPSKLLYESVKAHDLMTGCSRALVVIKMEHEHEHDESK
jgi:hypothetical protein